MKLDDLIESKFKEVKEVTSKYLDTAYHSVVTDERVTQIQKELSEELQAIVDDLSKPAKRKQYLIAAACFLTGLAIGIII